MSRAVPPTVRERARERTCPKCRALPGQKCAPDRAGRSQLHRDRIYDARRSLEPLPPYRILPPDTDRVLMEWDPHTADTPVVSWHHSVLEDLAGYPYEAAALLWLALADAGMLRPDGPKLSNFMLGLILMPIDFLTGQEILEAVDRLAARGFINRTDPDDIRALEIDRDAIRIVGRRELDPRFLMQWNAAKASWPGPPPPQPEA
ncbi:zinc finger domain-containing protein [Streptomyces cellulosae]|uniref:zinc finger domain-containing protein n=1 Tax=Streptomyces cellulosae TaxID=1968 RepID=UPI003F6988C6